MQFLNQEIFEKVAVDISSYTFGIFNYNNTHIGYNDGYLSLGISIDFANNTLKSMAKNYMINYFETNTLTDYKEPIAVAPHLKARMVESERLYQAHIRSNPELFESE